MDSVIDYSAEKWMRMDEASARLVFPGSASQVREAYRKLVGMWHPDRNNDPRAHDVFVKLHALYERALSVCSDAPPRPVASIEEEVVDANGRKFRYQAQHREPFELGQFYRANASFAYRVDLAHEDLFRNFCGIVRTFGFATTRMQDQVRPLLPAIHASPWGNLGGVLVLSRCKDAVRLADLVEFHEKQGSRLAPEHVAWIISGLFNIVCYLEYARIAHHAIDLSSVWVNPGTHEVLLPGGWFYARPFGEKLLAMPASAADMLPHRYIASRAAGPGADLALVRAVGRQLLGDRRGQRIPKGAAPPPFVDALLSPAGASALEDYRAWKKVLTASFGPPKFVPMNLNPATIYR